MGRRRRGGYSGSPYVSVARRMALRRLAEERLVSADMELQPIDVEGRQITRSFWGTAWCRHIESFHDYSNRLPRGRTYVRNGSVIHLEITEGLVRALVSGSRLTPYQQTIAIAPLPKAKWQSVVGNLAGSVATLVELLEGKLSTEVMGYLMGAEASLLPDLREVKLSCNCPDWASLCKHLAAVLYGVGVRLDRRPELLFTLRGVAAGDLIAASATPLTPTIAVDTERSLTEDLATLFDIELDDGLLDSLTTGSAEGRVRAARASKKTSKKKTSKKKTSKKQTSKKKTSKKNTSKKNTATRIGARRTTSSATATPRRPGEITRAELLELGVPAGTLTTWVFTGVLAATEKRGVYRQTAESRRRLKARRSAP